MRQAFRPAKLVLGVAFYGRGFTGVKPLNNGLNQPYERYEADHSYAELAGKFIGKQGFVRYWDDRAQAPYLWNERDEDVHYLRRSAVDRGQRRATPGDNHLGGMMFWELSQDRDGELLDVIARHSR